jgi:hypothetical protein
MENINKYTLRGRGRGWGEGGSNDPNIVCTYK